MTVEVTFAGGWGEFKKKNTCRQEWNQQAQRAGHENADGEEGDAATAALQRGFARLFQQFDREKKAVEDERNYLLKAQFDHEQRVTALRASAESQGARFALVVVHAGEGAGRRF